MATLLPEVGHSFCPAVEGIGAIEVLEGFELNLQGISADKKKAILESFHLTYPALKPEKANKEG